MQRTVAVFLLAFALTAWSSAGLLHAEQEKAVKQNPTLDVPYEPTSCKIVHTMLSMAKVTSKDLVYDLGCGDGRIVITAVKERGARGVGVDLDPVRIKESRQNAEAAGVSKNIQFFEQNLFETDITRATAVMLYLWPEVNLKLRPKLLRELKPGTRIVSHSHTMGDWEPDAVRTVENHKLNFFIVPANVTGSWQATNAGTTGTSLRLTQKFQQLKGFLRIAEDEIQITGTARGNAIRFSGEGTSGNKGVLSFDGHVSGNVMKGKITSADRRTKSWEAKRDPSTILPIAE